MKNFRKKSIVAIMLSFAMLICGISTVLSGNFKTTYAETTNDGIEFNATVVSRTLGETYNIYDIDTTNLESKVISDSNVKKYTDFGTDKTSIALNKYVMLERELDDKVENIHITFGKEQANQSDGAYIAELQVGITLSNQYYTKSLYSLPPQQKNNNNENIRYYFEQYFDLYYCEDIDGNSIENLEGQYTFTFTYRTKEGNNLSAVQTVSYSFFAIREESYANELNTFDSSYKTYEAFTTDTNGNEPEKIGKNNYIYSPFIENVKNEHDVKDDNSDYKYYSYYTFEDRSKLPKIIFNNKQYVVSVSRSYFAEASSFAVGNGAETIDYNKNYSVETTGDKTTITFNTLGEYTISYSYVFEGVVLNEANTIKNKQFNIKTEKLTIFGAQIYYALDTTGEDELYSENYNSYLADEYNTLALPSSIPSTNQGPVWFKYLGNIQSSSNYCTWNGENWKSEGKYINGYKFSNNGIYLVEINYKFDEFTNIVKNYYNDSYINEKQYFSFEIKSVTPYIKAYTTETENENTYKTYISNGYNTNKNVYIEVEPNTKGVFDSDVKLEVYSKDNLYTTLYGYDEINDFASALSTENETQTKYTLKLYYGPKFNGQQNSFSTFTFTIDKKAPTLRWVDDEIITNFINVRTNSFGVVCNDSDVKEIKYCYSLLSNIGTYSLVSDQDKLNIKNGYAFSSLTSELNYTLGTNISVDGLYLFSVTDKAGNKTERTVIIDNSMPYMLQNPVQDAKNVYNLFSNDVSVYAGQYKVVDASNVYQTLTNKLNNANEQSFNKYFASENMFKVLNNSSVIVYIDANSNIEKLVEEYGNNNYESATSKQNAVNITDATIASQDGFTLFAPTDDGNSVYFYDTKVQKLELAETRMKEHSNVITPPSTETTKRRAR